MEVILNQTIPKIGRAGEIVKVADGYARNFLIPRGLAAEATRGVRKSHAALTANLERKADSIRANAEALRDKLEGKGLELKGKTAANSTKLFGAITAQNVAEAIKAQLGTEVDKRSVGILHPIKSTGAHEVSLHLHPGVDAKITVNVTPTEA